MSNKLKHFRLDFKMEVISSDETSRTLEVRLIPNPDRYEWVTHDGKKALFDKLDHLLIPEDIFFEGMKKMADIPIGYQPQLIKDASEYVLSRIDAIKSELTGNFPTPTFSDKSEEFLQSLETDKLGFVILSLDVVGSTLLSTTIPEDDYRRLISALLYEASTVIPLFHGHVLKYVGDSVVAYFPEPSFITKNDLAIDCALTLHRLIYDGFNPVLKSLGFKEIDIRIGLDSGNAYIVTIGNPSTKQHKDIIGALVNLAAKIQSIAKPGQITLGQVTLQNLHTNWRLRCQSVELLPSWTYLRDDGKPYEVFTITP
jgi:adenylate cyclase